MLAFPLERMDGRVKYLKDKNKMDVSEYIEKDIWPVFAKMLLGLSYADNLYVFKNKKCYELGKGGKIKECTIENKGKQNKINDENDRVAILAVEIIHKKQVVGALVIEFFETLT